MKYLRASSLEAVTIRRPAGAKGGRIYQSTVRSMSRERGPKGGVLFAGGRQPLPSSGPARGELYPDLSPLTLCTSASAFIGPGEAGGPGKCAGCSLGHQSPGPKAVERESG